MEASNLEQGELYVCREFPRDRVSPMYQRDYAGKTAVYMGFEPEYMEHYGETSERYKLLLNGELRYLPKEFLRHMKKVVDKPVKT